MSRPDRRACPEQLRLYSGMQPVGLTMELISRYELKAKLDRGDRFKLVMALGEAPHRSQSIPGTLRFGTYEDGPRALRPDDEIILYCSDSTARTSIAARASSLTKCLRATGTRIFVGIVAASLAGRQRATRSRTSRSRHRPGRVGRHIQRLTCCDRENADPRASAPEVSATDWTSLIRRRYVESGYVAAGVELAVARYGLRYPVSRCGSTSSVSDDGCEQFGDHAVLDEQEMPERRHQVPDLQAARLVGARTRQAHRLDIQAQQLGSVLGNVA
jgi:hypothetical protein